MVPKPGTEPYIYNIRKGPSMIYFSDISVLFTEASCEHVICNISQDLPDTHVSYCMDRDFHVAGHSVTLPVFG